MITWHLTDKEHGREFLILILSTAPGEKGIFIITSHIFSAPYLATNTGTRFIPFSPGLNYMQQVEWHFSY